MRRQQGFALLELIAAVLIATLLAVWGAGTLVNKINDAAAQAMAVWMLSVKQATHAYIERYASLLVRATDAGALADKGYANWLNPTLAELKADRLLSPGFPERGAHGLDVAIRLLRSGSCPDADCRIQALIHSTSAVVHTPSGQVDDQMVAQWLMASQGWGGTVARARPEFIAGAAFSLPNPPDAQTPLLPVGTLALAITSEQLAGLDYLQVGDSRDPDFQGPATVQGDIQTQGSLGAKNYIYIGARQQAYSACDQDGAVAREYFRGLLICQDRQWRSAGGSGGGGFSTNSKYGCADRYGSSTANPVTGACNCPPGYAMVSISDSGDPAAAQGSTRGFLCVD
jgi:prepilin-type N-terminal cleavage/methylation domain-containing protein